MSSSVKVCRLTAAAVALAAAGAFNSDAHAAPIVGQVRVVQNDASNTATGVSVSVSPVTTGSNFNVVTTPGATRGDFALSFRSNPTDDLINGVLIASTSENGRSNAGSDGTNTIPAGPGYATIAIQSPVNIGSSYAGIGTAVSLSNANLASTPTNISGSGAEWNANHSFGYFKYSEFVGGWVVNDVNNGVLTRFVGSTPGMTVSSGATDPGTSTVFDTTDTTTTGGGSGLYRVRLDAFTASRGGSLTSVPATSANGILLAVGGKNEDNYAMTEAQPDGSFYVICKDNGSNATTYENDPVAFVFIPAGHSDVLAMGRIDAEGDAFASSGTFTMSPPSVQGTGQWLLKAPGRNDSNSVLLLTGEGASVTGTNRADNIVSAQWSSTLDGWLIQSRDLPGDATNAPGLQGGAANEVMFSFALFPVVPEPAALASLGVGVAGLLGRRRRP